MEKDQYFKNSVILAIVFIMAAILFSIAGLSQCTFIKKYPQDNPVEEWVEDIIEKKTGLDLDLSPGTAENER